MADPTGGHRLADAASPYLRAHAGNPVAWHPWGEEAFAEAARRGVPVLVSIGYATCHWCHVMARESFSDPAAAAYLNEHFVSIKVDREEHPEVDAAYLAAASAFTRDLGWPLTAFATPEGRVFHADTYLPPRPHPAKPSFGQVLEAVHAAWSDDRARVEDSAARLDEALAEVRGGSGGVSGAGNGAGTSEDTAERILDAATLDDVLARLAAEEDLLHGGFGTPPDFAGPKFPEGPVLRTLADLGRAARASGAAGARDEAAERASALARRTLLALAQSPLRDAVSGGFFRYSPNRDWTQPHYERMLYDNALLLQAVSLAVPFAETGLSESGPGGAATVSADIVGTRDRDALVSVAGGIASTLLSVFRRPSGAFASAQDSESRVDGVLSEGGYWALDEAGRAAQPAPAIDDKVLAGWNGLAIEALAEAGLRLHRDDWIDAARAAADHLLAVHRRADGTLARLSVDGRPASATAALEDYGMLAAGLVTLTATSGIPRYAIVARELVEACLADGVFALPGGGDPLLAAQGLAFPADPSEGAYPSGVSSLAHAALRLHLLGAGERFRAAAQRASAPLLSMTVARPRAHGAMLGVLTALAHPARQLVVVGDRAGALAEMARSADLPFGMIALVSEEAARELAEAGFDLFADRTARGEEASAYLCADFVCRLPVSRAQELSGMLG